MHWGGGTPTYLDDGEITELMHALASNFRLLDKGYREYSIEIDPRTVSPRRSRFSRASASTASASVSRTSTSACRRP
jgi:coproporphyrinogen III oxidase-like Fe-S oxidoreductase